jgi:hypothetical protein
MNFETILKPLLDQGVLGILLVVMIFGFKKLMAEFIVLVKSNTQSMQENAGAIRELKEVIRKCEQ